jgi:hypothetical protein
MPGPGSRRQASRGWPSVESCGRLDRSPGYSEASTSRMSVAVSLGVLPTLTPAASRASLWTTPAASRAFFWTEEENEDHKDDDEDK